MEVQIDAMSRDLTRLKWQVGELDDQVNIKVDKIFQTRIHLQQLNSEYTEYENISCLPWSKQRVFTESANWD